MQLTACLFILAAFFVAPAPTRAAVPFDPNLAYSLDDLLKQSVATGHPPGALMAVALPDHEVWMGARGRLQRGRDDIVTVDSLFYLASVSKLYVATVAMQLVEEGWLSLDQTVEFWLPGLVPEGKHITVRQLMSHTSGLYDYLSEGFAEQVLRDPGRVWTPQELVAAGSRQVFAPGARWSYSNTNYVVLGLIIERVTGHSLTHELHQRIVDRLGLQRTFVAPDDALVGDLMHGYEGQRDETVGANLSFVWGAGHIVATAGDVARFGDALFGGVLLQPESLDAMQRFASVGRWGTPGMGYGLGMMRSVLRGAALPTTTVLGHEGALFGYRTALWYDPASRATVVVAYNQMRATPDTLALRAFNLLGNRSVSGLRAPSPRQRAGAGPLDTRAGPAAHPEGTRPASRCSITESHTCGMPNLPARHINCEF